MMKLLGISIHEEMCIRDSGCSEEFLFDWQLLINEVKAYQLESPATVKLPKLSPTETDVYKRQP